jgi:hypothetical protein
MRLTAAHTDAKETTMAEKTVKKSGEKKPAAPKDRAAVKAQLKPLKKEREAAKEAKDPKKLASVRKKYRAATHALRATAAPKGKKAKKE